MISIGFFSARLEILRYLCSGLVMSVLVLGCSPCDGPVLMMPVLVLDCSSCTSSACGFCSCSSPPGLNFREGILHKVENKNIIN